MGSQLRALGDFVHRGPARAGGTGVPLCGAAARCGGLPRLALPRPSPPPSPPALPPKAAPGCTTVTCAIGTCPPLSASSAPSAPTLTSAWTASAWGVSCIPSAAAPAAAGGLLVVLPKPLVCGSTLPPPLALLRRWQQERSASVAAAAPGCCWCCRCPGPPLAGVSHSPASLCPSSLKSTTTCCS